MTSTMSLNGASNVKKSSTGGLSEWKKKLITKEDPIHVHKTLGILALFSYIVRFVQFGESDMAFKTHPAWTIPTILLHFLLNLSAFDFKLPKQRIDSGYRIWPEYRLHNMCFLCRSLACIGLNWYEMYYGLEPNYSANIVIVLATLAAADISTYSCGPKYTSGSIKDLDTAKFVRFFFSLMQFYGTCNHLFGLRRSSAYFYMAFVVQINSFMMTLRRKNLVSHNFGVAFYGLILAFGFSLITCFETPSAGYEALRITGTVANLVFLFRVSPLPDWLSPIKNKYFLWACAGFFMRELRPILTGYDALLTVPQLRTLHYVSIAGVALMGWYKCNYDYNKTGPDKPMKKVD